MCNKSFVYIAFHLLCLLLACFNTNIKAQSTFQLGIGTHGYESGNVITTSPSGGFIIGGNTESYGLIESSMLLVETDSSGAVKWSKSYGSLHHEVVANFIQTPDEGVIVVGEKYQLNRSQGEFLNLFKTDRGGNLLWSKLYDEGGNETEGFSIAKTNTGDYIVAGVVRNVPAYNSVFRTVANKEERVYMLKVDGSGNTIWSRNINTPSGDFLSKGNSVVVTSDDSYVVTGSIAAKEKRQTDTDNSGKPLAGILLAKVQSDGSLAWTTRYGAYKIASGSKLIKKQEGGFIIAGLCAPSNENNTEAVLLSVDDEGRVQWAKTYGGEGFDTAKDIVQTPDGGFIISGETRSFGADLSDILIFKTSNNGDLQWAKRYGGPNEDFGGLMTMVGNGVVFTGATSMGKESFDVLLAKINWMGESECRGVDVPLLVNELNITGNKINGIKALHIKQPEETGGAAKMELQEIKEQKRQVRVMRICD